MRPPAVIQVQTFALDTQELKCLNRIHAVLRPNTHKNTNEHIRYAAQVLYTQQKEHQGKVHVLVVLLINNIHCGYRLLQTLLTNPKYEELFFDELTSLVFGIGNRAPFQYAFNATSVENRLLIFNILYKTLQNMIKILLSQADTLIKNEKLLNNKGIQSEEQRNPIYVETIRKKALTSVSNNLEVFYQDTVNSKQPIISNTLFKPLTQRVEFKRDIISQRAKILEQQFCLSKQPVAEPPTSPLLTSAPQRPTASPSTHADIKRAENCLIRALTNWSPICFSTTQDGHPPGEPAGPTPRSISFFLQQPGGVGAITETTDVLQTTTTAASPP